MAKNRNSRAKSKTLAVAKVAETQPTAVVAELTPEAPVTVTESVVVPAEVKPAPRLPTHDEIARRAYELWLRKGAPLGTHLEDWLLAERELSAA